MFLHETHLEVLISPRYFHLCNLSLFLSWLCSSIAYLRLQVVFYLMRFLG